MCFFVRNLKKGTWCERLPDNPETVRPDALKNFATEQDRLSVFECDGEKQHADRVAVAVATGRNRLTEVEYILFGDDLNTELGIQVEKSEGRTKDKVANSHHRDLTISSANQLAELVTNVCARSAVTRLEAFEVAPLLLCAIESGRIDRTHLHEQLLRDLSDYSC